MHQFPFCARSWNTEKSYCSKNLNEQECLIGRNGKAQRMLGDQWSSRSSNWSALNSSAMSESSQPHRLQSTGVLYPWNFPGKNIGRDTICSSRSNWRVLGNNWRVKSGENWTEWRLWERPRFKCWANPY